MSAVDRVEYEGEGLTEAELAPTPWQQASRWVDEANERARAVPDVPEPAALSVATVDAAGRPDVRTVLMRFFDPAGPGFVTNLGSAKGLHLSVGIRPSVDADTTKGFALALGKVLESRDPKRVTVTMAKEQRGGRVFVDWSQNDRHKTTVCAYSLRATDVPGVSTPVSWEEVDELADGRDPGEFAFSPTDVIERVEELGDLYADSLAGDQDLPELG